MTVVFDFWACQRPLTHHWGSGQVWNRLCRKFGKPDAAFGKQDGIPGDLPLGFKGIDFFDLSNGHDWNKLDLETNAYEFGYWDPPYDKLYKSEGKEIWRVCKRLAILHTFIWPRSWLRNAEREGMVAITMGPLKQIRCLQVFRKVQRLGE